MKVVYFTIWLKHYFNKLIIKSGILYEIIYYMRDITNLLLFLINILLLHYY